jgi:hypothetical protein
VWTVRDHFLRLEIDGKEVSPNDYLEHCLKTKPGVSAHAIKYNGIREATRLDISYFQKMQQYQLIPSSQYTFKTILLYADF